MPEKRPKMKPLLVEESTYRCEYEKQWPPGVAKIGENFQWLRATALITEVEFQRLQTWERVCGLLRMDEAKCLTCPHVRKVTKNGLVPVVGEDGEPLLQEAPSNPAPPCSRRTKAIRSKGKA